ncbi:triose-phosphate isomerase family protein [Dermabacter hominis]
MRKLRVGVSLKMYFDRLRAESYFAELANMLQLEFGAVDAPVQNFIVPSYLHIPAAVSAFAHVPMEVGIQDSSEFQSGAYTGEVSPLHAAEMGVRLTELGHAERRRLFGENDATVNAKLLAAMQAGLTPLICVGETDQFDSNRAAEFTIEQVEAATLGAPTGPLIIAYEPVWAIGANKPASVDHIARVCGSLQLWVDSRPEREGSSVIYGGSAGPGLFSKLDGAVDGLFLGRFAHEPRNFIEVVQEVAAAAC